MIIAIDGPCGTGKSSVAQQVAKKNNFIYLDSGALYRLLAYLLLKKHLHIESDEDVLKLFDFFDFDIQKNEDGYRYYLEGEDVSLAIRQPKVSQEASKISQSPIVRKKLLPIQRAFGARHSIVMEGRDIATVVFPHADIKIFLTASEPVRAQRRLDELRQKFPLETHQLDKVLEDIKKRDAWDETRALAPLKPAEDSVIIDTSSMSKEEVIDVINKLIEQKRKKIHA